MSSESQRITCPQCRASLKVVVAAPGELQACPKCGTQFLAPTREPVHRSSADPNAEWDDLFGPSPAGGSEGEARPASPAARMSAQAPIPLGDALNKPPSVPEAGRPVPAASASPAVGGGVRDQGMYEDDDAELRLEAPVDTPKVPVAAVADQFTFSVPCRVCGTLLDCLSTEIGRTVQCPDCHSKVVVPPPREAQARTPAGQHPLATGAVSELAPAPLPTSDPHSEQVDVIRRNAAAMLAKAKAEQEEIDQREGEVFDDSKAVDIVRFLIDPLAIMRLVAIALTGMAALVLIRWSLPLFTSDKPNFALIGFLLAAGPFTGAWLIAGAAHAVALFRDTATRQTNIGWPEANFFDWLGQGMSAILAAVYSGLPGAVLAASMISADIDWIYGLLMVVFSWIALFPPTFISMSHEASLAAIVSLPVYRSISELRGAWVLFYQASFLLGLVTWGLMTIAFAETALVVPLVLGGITLFGALYFRLLGWLGGQLGPVLAPDDDEPESAAEN